MKTKENNNQEVMNTKTNITAILLSVASIVWMIVFFVYALAFNIEILCSAFGTFIFVSTTVLVLGLTSALMCKYKEKSEIIAAKDAEFLELLDKYLTLLSVIQRAKVDAKLSMTLHETRESLEELRLLLGLQDKTAELRLSDSQKQTMLDLIKILSECENLES